MAEDMNKNRPQTDGSEDGLRATPETVRVRQGVTGHNVRYVLWISLGAVIIGMILVGVYPGWM